MGMGHAGVQQSTVKTEGVKEICPDRFETLEKVLNHHDIGIDELAQQVRWDEFEDFPDDVERMYRALTEEFKEKTGIDLGLCYHDQEDEGDRYDDINGAFWVVWPVYELTDDAKKLQKKIDIEDVSYVVWG